MVQRTIGQRQLQKSLAVQEIDESSSEDEDSLENSKEIIEESSRTEWEELQDIYFQKRYTRARNASQESFMEDEDACEINLSNMYQESSRHQNEKSPSFHQEDVTEEKEVSLAKEVILEKEISLEKPTLRMKEISLENENFTEKASYEKGDEISQGTLDVIDELILSFERESNEKLDAAPTINLD